MKKIHFIINPIAGFGNQQLTADFLYSHLGTDEFSISVKYSNFKRHASQLTRSSIAEGAHIIVACGGDGTINEVASCLVGTPIALGIIPLGSGNGLASNLRIPTTIVEALTVIRKQNNMAMDVGLINGRYFFSNMGIGFDACVIKNYDAQKRRKLSGYLRAVWLAMREVRSMKDLEIEIDDIIPVVNPFMIFVSNSNEMGFSFTLTPQASLSDGKLDIMIIPKLGRVKMLLFGLLLLLKKPYLFKSATSFQTDELQILCKNHQIEDTQIDGEYCQMNTRHIGIRIKEGALKVLVPDKLPQNKYALNYL